MCIYIYNKVDSVGHVYFLIEFYVHMTYMYVSILLCSNKSYKHVCGTASCPRCFNGSPRFNHLATTSCHSLEQGFVAAIVAPRFLASSEYRHQGTLRSGSAISGPLWWAWPVSMGRGSGLAKHSAGAVVLMDVVPFRMHGSLDPLKKCHNYLCLYPKMSSLPLTLAW